MLTRSAKRQKTTLALAADRTHKVWNVVLAHDATYSSVLREWRWLWILCRVNKGFADTLRPLRTQIIRWMCANDPGPLLWPGKAMALFGCRHIIRKAALPPGLSFEAINAAFVPTEPIKTELQLHTDYHRLCEELKLQKQANGDDYDRLNLQAVAEYNRERQACTAQYDHDRMAIDAELERIKVDDPPPCYRDVAAWSNGKMAAIALWKTHCDLALERMTQRSKAILKRLNDKRDANFEQWGQRLYQNLHQNLNAKPQLDSSLRELREDRAAAAQAKRIALAHGAAFPELYDLPAPELA